MIKKNIYKHDFLKGGPLIFEWTTHQIPSFDYANLYPQIHTIDYDIILGEPRRDNEIIMESLDEMLNDILNERRTNQCLRN